MTGVMEPAWTMPLASDDATLAQVGGKGASLAGLAAAGFPVPPGFLITTDAYRRFVADNTLQPVIADALARIDPTDPVTIERAGASSRAAFEQAPIPDAIVAAIRNAWQSLGSPPPAVAIRSSATAEDLPGLSFAGQQETYLDVRGDAALLAAVRRCWASLWTARAIAYRARMGVDQHDVAMAVVVQEMAPAEASGVLFTANPATGDRGQIVIEAVQGLGETLVGGAVTPISILVDRQTLAPVSDSLDAAEAHSGSSGERLLPAGLVRDLAQFGLRVEQHAGGAPQDIEWAFGDGRVWLLQARPITNLPAPAPAVVWESPQPGATWVRRQVVEHMPEPLSPLFAELYLDQGLDRSARATMRAMGVEEMYERLLDGPFFTTVNGFGYSRGNFALSPRAALQMARMLVTGPLWIFRHGVEFWREEGLFPYLATIARWQAVAPRTASDATLLRGVRELAWADARYWFPAAIAIGAAKVSDAILDGFLRLAAPERDLHSGLFLRGFPSKTLEAEAELDAIARWVRESAALRDLVSATPAESLLDALPDTPPAQTLCDDLDRYFAHYGHQIYNLDFVAPTLVDAPLPVLIGLKGRVREPRQDARTRQQEMARQRDALVEETARSFDPLRRFLFRRLTSWAQRFAHYRENALFYLGAAWPTLRRLALELGRRLTAAGSLAAADHVFFLDSGELEAAIAARAVDRARPDLSRLARERVALREERRRLHPPAAVPPTARMQVGGIDLSERETQRRNPADATTLRGFAVSPGRVTAPASVIHSPAEFARMEPGTILVCPTTTPAWTPLFTQARGLVTDIGGILAHGSIVAREYGIPAVMGTGNATQRIASGQEIAVDGSAGTVDLQPRVRQLAG
jgi:phosphohistidine swiveling domain-containing protein